MNKAEQYFNDLRVSIERCSTTNDLLIIMCRDIKAPIVASYKAELRRVFNKKHKGSFNKCKEYCIEYINTGEYNYFSE